MTRKGQEKSKSRSRLGGQRQDKYSPAAASFRLASPRHRSKISPQTYQFPENTISCTIFETLCLEIKTSEVLHKDTLFRSQGLCYVASSHVLLLRLREARKQGWDETKEDGTTYTIRKLISLKKHLALSIQTMKWTLHYELTNAIDS